MAQINADEITQLLKEQIENYGAEISVDETGTIITLGDGIARIHGLDKAMAGEMLKFPHGVEGLAMNLDEDQVGCVILGDYTVLREGDEVITGSYKILRTLRSGSGVKIDNSVPKKEDESS